MSNKNSEPVTLEAISQQLQALEERRTELQQQYQRLLNDTGVRQTKITDYF